MQKEENSFEVSGNSPTQTPWLTAKEAAQYLRVEPRTLLMWARAGNVKGYPLSGLRRITWRFLHSDLDDMLLRPSVALKTRRVN